MALSIIVPTLNEERYIGTLLESLAQQVIETEYEVIVVDASHDAATALAVTASPGGARVSVVKSDVADAGYQRNLGARLARFETLLFIDADVILGPHVIQRCLRLIRHDELVVLAVRHRSDRGSLLIGASLAVVYALIVVAHIFKYPVTNGDFLLTNVRTFRAIEGFKQGYLLGEDTDFGFRAKRSGARQRFEWRSSVTASSRRLSVISPMRLVALWVRVYVRVIRGKGPAGQRSQDAAYPFGEW